MRSRKHKFGLFTLAFLLGSASVRAQLPPETTQPPAAGKDSAIKAKLAEPQQPAPTPAAGTVKKNPKDGLKYVWIPPGTFMMGCSPGDKECAPWEKPRHQVTITKGFWIGQTPVTEAAYQRYVSATGPLMRHAPGFTAGWANQEMPADGVYWDEGQAYCQWSGGRLPTEAEWEYAARGGSTVARYGALDEIAWYGENSGRQHLDGAEMLKEGLANYLSRLRENGNSAHEVGQKRANGFGLYDTLGNVGQWVSDWYDPNYYRHSPSQDPSGPSTGRWRVMRGGYWNVLARGVRVSVRGGFGTGGLNYGGVRCVEEANAFPLGPASARAQLPPETTQPPVPGKDSTDKATPNEPQQPAPAPAAGTVKENQKGGLKYVWIPPGTFMMGCSPGDECADWEKPSHQVTITKGFWMGQTPVTVAAYNRFAAATGQEVPPAPGFNAGWANQKMPIVNVSWNEAQAYCQWSGGRLPTEAEWEYAARAGSTEARYGPLDEIAWYADNSGPHHLDSARIQRGDSDNYFKRVTENGNGTHEVSQKRANALGLYDTLGNAWEWVNDWWDQNYYQNSPSLDPTGPSSGQYHVLRGGSWIDVAAFVRVSFRITGGPAVRGGIAGVRCVGEANIP